MTSRTSRIVPAVMVTLPDEENSVHEREFKKRREEVEERLQGFECTEGRENNLTVPSLTLSFKSKLCCRGRATCVSNNRSHRWFTNSLLFLQIFLALSTTFSSAAAMETCSKHLVVHKIRYRNCVPKNQLATACFGSCRSYAAIDGENPLRIMRTCNCCQATEFRHSLVRLQCPRPDGQIGYRWATVGVRLPMTCMCRPCAQLPEIQAAEFMT